MTNSDKKYRLKYQDKWMKVKRVHGQFFYNLFDDIEDVPAERPQKIRSARSLVSEDCEISIDEIEVVEE